MSIYPIQMERVFYRSPSEHLVLKGTILQSYHNTKCQRALKELLRVHPRLTCTVKEDQNHNIYYETNQDRSIPIKYYVGTRENDWKFVVKEELKIPFLMEQDLTIRVCIVDRSNEFDLIMIMHHLLGDGLSLLYTYEDFLQIYFHNSKLPQKELQPLKCSDLPKDSRLNFITRAVIHHLNHLWNSEKTIFTDSDFQTMFQKFQENNSNDFSIGVIDPTVLRQLYEKAHEHNVTINSILITALLYQVTQSSISTKPDQKVIVATNMRQKLFSNPVKGIGNYASCISPMLSYNDTKDFWSNVKLIHEKVQKQLNSKREFFSLSQTFGVINTSIFDGLYFSSYSDFQSKNVCKVRKVLKAGQKDEGLDISNLGRFTLDANSKLTLVKDFVYLPPTSSSVDITVGVITVSNQMCLGLIYNENRFDYQTINLILQSTIALLTRVSESTHKGEHNEKESESENVI